jgi:hypothetical protein
MAITDWTINKSNPATIVAGIDPIDFLVGAGSLRLIDFDNGTFNMYNNTYVRGLTRGRMRMLIQLGTEISSLGDDFYNVGMYVMSTDDDITVPDTFGQRFYTLSLAFDLFTNSHSISLDYHDNAIEDMPFNLFTSAPFTITRGVDIVPLELEWKLEDEFGPGIYFTVRSSLVASTQVDFSNLVELTELVVNNPSITLTSSIGEGLYFEGLGGSLPSGLDALVDQVSIFSLTRL